MTTLICLCGARHTPKIGGIRGGRTPNRELMIYRDSLQRAQRYLDVDRRVQIFERELADWEDLRGLSARIEVLERKAGRWLAQEDASRSPRGRYWAPPVRNPASGGDGTLTRDRLVLELQSRGLLFRKARQVVRAILQILIERLQVGEELKTLLGTFRIKRRPRPKKVKRFGREVILNQQSKRVAFEPGPELKTALCAAQLCHSSGTAKEAIPMSETKTPQPLRCPECGSHVFTEAAFQQFSEAYASASGAEVQSLSDPIYMLVCLCGNIIQPTWLRARKARNEDKCSFQESFEAAHQYLDAHQPTGLIRKLAETFATTVQYYVPATRVARLETFLKSSKKKSK